MPRTLAAAELARYDIIPRELAEKVKIYRVPVLPPNADAMTVANFVFVKADDDRDGDRTLFAHELVHVEQFAELGFFGFLSRYFRDYLKNLWELRNHREAYLAIPLEIEARRVAASWKARRNQGQLPDPPS